MIYGIIKTNIQRKIINLPPNEGNIDTCGLVCPAAGIPIHTESRTYENNNDRPSLIWAHLKSFSVCRMLRGICVNELHHSCEMMAQLGKQKCKVWQFKWMCFVSVYKQHLRDSIKPAYKNIAGGLEVGNFTNRFLPCYSAP